MGRRWGRSRSRRRGPAGGKASWWRGSEPGSQPRPCWEHRPKLVCGLRDSDTSPSVSLQCYFTITVVSGTSDFLCFPENVTSTLQMFLFYNCQSHFTVLPSSSTASTVAPLLSSACTTVARPLRAARWRGLEERGWNFNSCKSER